MHLPLFHISDRNLEPPLDEDPLGLGQMEMTDLIPYLADPIRAVDRAGMRTPFLDVVSLALAALGSEVTYFALMGGLFSSYDRPTALSMAAVILPSVTINQLVKTRFKFNRPPRIAMHPLAFVAPGDFTFPSGHAQNSVTLGLFLAQRAKRDWVKITGLMFAACVPLSRLYLGVHYPRDVLAGALLGIGTLAGSTALEEPFKRWWKNSPRGARGFTSALTCGIAGVLTGTPLAAFPLGLGGGLALGHDISGSFRYRVDRPFSRKRQIAQGVLGTAIVMGTGFAIRPLLKRESTISASLAGGVVGVALTLGIPLATSLGRRIHRFRVERKSRKKKIRIQRR